MIVTRSDTTRMGYCNAGARQFFALHGLSWSLFVNAGLPESAFDHVKHDPMIARLLAAARIRHGQE